MNFSNILFFLYLVLMLISYAVIGGNEMNEALAYNKRYCRNVNSGVWPDFNKNFNTLCPTLATEKE